MNTKPLSPVDRQLLLRLQGELDELRARLQIFERGCILFRADLSCCDDRVVLVEADGLGGAVMRVIEGNYPVDYSIYEEREFPTESEAVAAAEESLR